MKSSSTPSFAAKICAAGIGGPLIALTVGAPIALAAPSAGSGSKQASSTDNSQSGTKAGPRSPSSAARVHAADEPQPTPDFAVSFNGRSIVQSGSATATSDPGFNLAVAGAGSNAYAGGGGLFNVAVADHNSTAKATGGILNFAAADENSTAIAEDGIFTVAQAQNNSTAKISGGKLNTAEATDRGTATVSGRDRNTASADGDGSTAFAGNGNNNEATAYCGSNADASGGDDLVVTTPVGGCQ
ncbi:hypothetical protein MycrhDRAFT_3600 [Mycolicibacterium rhodesiae JS60]|nr:hypothetical protein MycrhDRAFT_3600 [Mycolicibacterium rhodesiae JS60]